MNTRIWRLLAFPCIERLMIAAPARDLAQAPSMRLAGRLLLLLAACLCLNAQAMLLSSRNVSLAGEIDFLHDPGASWSVRDMARPDIAGRFERLRGEPSLGYLPGAVWLRVTLERPATVPELWWLEVASPLFDDVRLYAPTDGGGFTERRAGTDWPFSGRDVAYRLPVFELRLPPGQARTLYLRIATDNALALRLTVSTPERFAAWLGAEQLIFGFFLAVHLAVILSSFWNFRASREPAYGYLAAFALSFMGSTAASEGLIFQYLLPGHPGWSQPLMLVFWVLGPPLFLLFLLNLLRIPHRQGWLRAYLWTLWAVAGLTLALGLGGHFQWVSPRFQIWSLLSSVLAAALLVRESLAGNRDARTLMLGSIMLWLGIVARYSRNLGWLPSSLAYDYLYLFGMITHLLVMSYAASRRYLDLRHAKEEAQARALQLSQDAERKLEAQVAERTHALRHSLALVKTSLNVQRRAHDDQRRFFATVSHELRTPLAVIDATVQNLELDGDALDPATQRRHAKIQRASAQLATLVRNCFQEDRFEPLNRGARRRPADLNELLRDALESASLLSSRHQLQIAAGELPRDFPCDAELTRLTLRTLAGNAVKYTPPGTRVVLRARAGARGVTIHILDNGPGVAAEDLPHLFERYYRGQNAAGVPGTGLGLPLARELIETQGGSLRVVSTPGRGFLAIVKLPLASATPVPAAPAQERRSTAQWAHDLASPPL